MRWQNMSLHSTSETRLNENIEKAQLWDTETQQYHGGQEWAGLETFVEDFSVTTNPLGTPKHALDAAKNEVNLFENYNQTCS